MHTMTKSSIVCVCVQIDHKSNDRKSSKMLHTSLRLAINARVMITKISMSVMDWSMVLQCCSSSLVHSFFLLQQQQQPLSRRTVVFSQLTRPSSILIYSKHRLKSNPSDNVWLTLYLQDSSRICFGYPQSDI